MPGQQALTLNAQTITATNAGNQWGSSLSIVAGKAVTLSAGSNGTTANNLVLGTVTANAGGRIDAGVLTLGGATTVSGGTLELVGSAPAMLAQPGDALAGKLATNLLVAYAADVVAQNAGSTITVAPGATLQVTASGGGSVNLAQPGNAFLGNLAVISGTADQAWSANPTPGTFGGNTFTYAMQSLANIAGGTVNVGGAGIVADVVAITANTLATVGPTAAIVARLPFDSNVGTTASLPALTLGLTPTSFTLPLPFGQTGTGNGIRVNIGNQALGGRTLGLNAGYMTVLPRGGAQGGTAVLLEGPAVGSGNGYQFFYDGAGQQAQIPVSYNGLLPTTPQAESSISATVAVSESARRERFEEAVRTENVATRLRSGVIAEVGPAPSATRGSSGTRLPAACVPASSALSCAQP